MSEVAHYYPMDVTRRTKITREQFEARQQAARKRWQATMTHADVPVIVVPWGSSSVAHGVVSTFEAIRVWVETNHVKVIQMVSDAGVRGRGGARFPTGTKWAGGRKAGKTPKYAICNSHQRGPNL